MAINKSAKVTTEEDEDVLNFEESDADYTKMTGPSSRNKNKSTSKKSAGDDVSSSSEQRAEIRLLKTPRGTIRVGTWQFSDEYSIGEHKQGDTITVPANVALILYQKGFCLILRQK